MFKNVLSQADLDSKNQCMYSRQCYILASFSGCLLTISLCFLLEEICDIMNSHNLVTTTVLRRRARNEDLRVLRIGRSNAEISLLSAQAESV